MTKPTYDELAHELWSLLEHYENLYRMRNYRMQPCEHAPIAKARVVVKRVWDAQTAERAARKVTT